jgi:peptide/nickel transport system permease protein
MTSWGLLLSQAHKVQVLKLYPWLLIPGLFIIISVLCFNFVGDGLRDVIDPYSL